MIRRFIKKRMQSKRAFRRYTLMLTIKILINAFSVQACAQTATNQGWPVLEAGLAQKSAAQRIAAVRVLGLIPDDAHAAELGEKSLKDTNSSVRAAAATALGQMRAMGADAALKQALNDKQLPVVMAAAHALRLLDDPACYEAYYAIFTGERKNDSGMIAQEMKVLHDPKQLAEMGFEEGIGYAPFAGIGWQAAQTILKDRKNGAAAKVVLISALATDPDVRTSKVLLDASGNRNRVLRVAALEAISKRGDPTLLPKIESRLSDPRREVKYTAAATVIHLNDLASAQAATAKTVLIALPANTGELPADVHENSNR